MVKEIAYIAGFVVLTISLKRSPVTAAAGQPQSVPIMPMCARLPARLSP